MHPSIVRAVFLGFFSLMSLPAFAIDASMGIEYGSVSLKPKKGGKSESLSSFRLNLFDTSGSLTAGIRGALNQNAAQKAKEYEIERSIKNGTAAPDGSTVISGGGHSYANYSYSWDQPAPTPTDGDRWTLTLATNGTPILDAVSAPTSAEKPISSMMGIEYSSSLWSYVSSPISISAGWGLKFFMFSAEGPNNAGIDSNATSVPLDVSISSQVWKDVVAFANIAVSPISLFKGKGYYLHEELGVTWDFYEGWILTANYRHMQDAVSEKDPDGNPYEYVMDSGYVGIGYQF